MGFEHDVEAHQQTRVALRDDAHRGVHQTPAGLTAAVESTLASRNRRIRRQSRRNAPMAASSTALGMETWGWRLGDGDLALRAELDLVCDRLGIGGGLRTQGGVVVPAQVLGELACLNEQRERLGQQRERLLLETVEPLPVAGLAEGEDPLGAVTQGAGYGNGAPGAAAS